MNLINFAKENYYTINPTNNRGYSKIEPFDFQLEYLKHIAENQKVIVMKSRQMFNTTTLAVYCLWEMLYNKKNVLYIAPNKSCGDNFNEKVKQLFHKVDKTNSININKMDKFSIRFDGPYGDVWLKTATRTIPKNFRFHIIIFDEFIDKTERIYSDFLDMYFGGNKAEDVTKQILVSSLGYSVLFEKLYNGLYSKEMMFKHELYYDMNPMYTPERLANLYDVIGEDKFEMEILNITPKSKKQKHKNDIVTFRIDQNIKQKIGLRLLETDKNVSDYIRDLILKDIGG